MDIYVKKAIIHQFSPDDTDLYLADKFLNITPKIEEYLRKKIERVYSDEAKTGIFEEDNPFLKMITDDLLETSVALANRWKEEFVVSDNQKTNDLVFIQFSKEGVDHFAFLRIALRETLTHLGGEAVSYTHLSRAMSARPILVSILGWKVKVLSSWSREMKASIKSN